MYTHSNSLHSTAVPFTRYCHTLFLGMPDTHLSHVSLTLKCTRVANLNTNPTCSDILNTHLSNVSLTLECTRIANLNTNPTCSDVPNTHLPNVSLTLQCTRVANLNNIPIFSDIPDTHSSEHHEYYCTSIVTSYFCDQY